MSCLFVLLFTKCAWVKVPNRLRIWIKVSSCHGTWVKTSGPASTGLKVSGSTGAGLEAPYSSSTGLETTDLTPTVSSCLTNRQCSGVKTSSTHRVGVKCSPSITMSIGIVVPGCNVIWVESRGARGGEKNV